MSKLKIVGNVEGAATLTIISPSSNTDATIELPHGDGTLLTDSQHLIPNEDEVYDLGSPTKRWKDLNVSATTIFLGDQPISANANGIVLPELTIGTGTNTVKLTASSDGKLKQISTDSDGIELPEVDIPAVLNEMEDVRLYSPTDNQVLRYTTLESGLISTVDTLEPSPTGQIVSQNPIAPTPTGAVLSYLYAGWDINRVDGTYTSVTGTTGYYDDANTFVAGGSGSSGTGATFDIVIDQHQFDTTGQRAGSASVTMTSPGTGYIVGDVIMISDANLGGGGAVDVPLGVVVTDAMIAGTYTGVTGTSSGTGSGATFDIVIDKFGIPTSVTTTDPGIGHSVGDVITFPNLAQAILSVDAAQFNTRNSAGFENNPYVHPNTTPFTAVDYDFQTVVATTDIDLVTGTYTGVTGTSSGTGTVGTFDIVIDANGIATSVTPITRGAGHAIGDIITIAAADLGGDGPDNFTMNVASVITSSGQLLWRNSTGPISVFSDFTDVDTVTTPPTDTQVLTWSDANNEWGAGNNGFPLTVANTTELLALTGMLVGQESFVTDLNRSYIYTESTLNDNWRHAVSGWYATDDIMTNHPTAEISGFPSSISVDSGATGTEITLISVDPTDFLQVWSAEVAHPANILSAYPDGLITISNVDNVFTITPATISLDDTSGFTGFVDIDVTWQVIDDCTDSDKISKELPVRFIFPNLNPSPITGAAESYNLMVGDIETITLTSTDPEGVPIIWSAFANPPFMGGTLITKVDNVFTIDAAAAASQVPGGPTDYNGVITFVAFDGTNTVSFNSTLVVDNLSPALITGLPTVLDLSITGTTQAITGNSYDPEGGPLTWSFTTSGNLGNTNISHDGNGSFTFSGTSHDVEHEFNLIVTVEDISAPVMGGNSQTHSILCTYEYPNVVGSQTWTGASTTGYNSSRGTSDQWTCPANVYFVHALCVGGGGHGSVKGGGGGGLGWKNNIPVNPGQTYNLFVGRGGENTDSMPSQYSSHYLYHASANGENKSYFISQSTVAGFAGRAAQWFDTSGTVGGGTSQVGGGFIGDGGGSGGRGIGGGGIANPTIQAGNSSGGGAGGYTGSGGAAGGGGGFFGMPQPYQYAESGAGGGGGGGAVGADKGGAGGGVGLNGIGSNGQGGQKGADHRWAQTSGNPPFHTSTFGNPPTGYSWYGSASPGGKGGSGGGAGGGPGMHGTSGNGGYYGGGANAYSTTKAGPGAVKLIWGPSKSWPNG